MLKSFQKQKVNMIWIKLREHKRVDKCKSEDKGELRDQRERVDCGCQPQCASLEVPKNTANMYFTDTDFCQEQEEQVQHLPSDIR